MSAWYESFFDELILDVWDRSNSEEQTVAEVSMLEGLLDCRAGDRILDQACGCGRHALELARRGCQVTAVDLSSLALDRIRERAGEWARNLGLVQCDLEFLEVDGPFDAAYCLGNSFGYLDSEATLAWFGRLAEVLKPGAGFLLHTGMAAESLLPNLDERNWVEVGGYDLLWESEYESREGRLLTRYTVVHGKRREVREAFHYVFTVAEIGRMLRSCGLEPVAHFASSDEEAFEVGDPELYLLACRSKR